MGWEGPLKKEMSTHSSILAWEILDRGAWLATVHGVSRVGHDSEVNHHHHHHHHTHTHTHTHTKIDKADKIQKNGCQCEQILVYVFSLKLNSNRIEKYILIE